MSRPGWNGQTTAKAIAYVVARDSGICHLCGHPGANSCDHVQPVSQHPELEWDPTNWKAAHLFAAGHPKGCQTPGCHCPGNRGRQDADADVVRRVVDELNGRAQTTDDEGRTW